MNLFRATLGLFASIVFLCGPTPAHADGRSPNIIFFVMDDVGVDQMKLYGYGKARMPNLEAIAKKGVVFTNAWVMPDCSPSRATFFTGQLPARTNVLNPIQPPDLANSQVSPYAMTLPKLLKSRGYVSALIGKMHLSGSEQEMSTNPLANETYRQLGFDYFNGYLDGSPLSIDTTAGLATVAAGTYSCGFIPNTTSNPAHGADQGACYYANGTCRIMTRSESSPTPGRTCLESGGILDPVVGDSSPVCEASHPGRVNFKTDNGYYTARWVENFEDGRTTHSHMPDDPAVDPREYRGYRSVVEANRTITWINEKKRSSQPWMVSVGFSSAHTPWQNVPQSILPADSVNTDGIHCTVGSTNAELRVLQQQMEEGLDHELGRILVETGIASRNRDGSLRYDPEESNTLIVIIGDNGTFGPVVNAPFEGSRAKGSPYQTGVWVPLIVAGPTVKSPGRKVASMVNGVDLYRLFAEVAGIDVEKAVPESQRLDAESMLSYLTQPGRQSIRRTNLTQTGDNLRLPEFSEGTTCVLPAPYNACTLFFPTKAICAKNGGAWYGAGSTVPGVPAEGLSDCCAVNEFRKSNGKSAVQVDPVLKTAVRDSRYKAVEIVEENCATPAPRSLVAKMEFYRIDENPAALQIDTAASNLLAEGRTVQDLTNDEVQAYGKLVRELDKWKDSVVSNCPGDGNADLVVNQKDVDGYFRFGKNPGNGSGFSSWFDFNHDGLTNQTDLDIITAHFGRRCGMKAASKEK